MGTRGFVGFVADGTEKIAYNHWDSYPGGLGADVLDWLSGVVGVELGVEAAKDTVRALRVASPDSVPTHEDIERLKGWADTGVGTKQLDEWYVLLRKTQGDPKAMLAAGVVEDAGNFPADSLFAEWGYITDFDANVFEVYEGFQREPHGEGRFANRAGENGYQPVKLIASWPFADLPARDAFLAAVEPSED